MLPKQPLTKYLQSNSHVDHVQLEEKKGLVDFCATQKSRLTMSAKVKQRIEKYNQF